VTDTSYASRVYVLRLKEYKDGKREKRFLHDLAVAASERGDFVNAEKIGNEYVRLSKPPYTKDELAFIDDYTKVSTDPGFDLFYRHPGIVDPLLGENAAINKVKSIIYKEEILPYQNTNTDWDKIGKKVIKKYGNAGEEIFMRAKVLDYFNKNEITKFAEAAIPYIKKYGDRVPLFELNNYAWAVFENVNDSALLKCALGWSEKTLQEDGSITFMDTYANLLYKLGKKREAISFEENAVKKASDKEKPEFQANLDKMKKGEKTWK